MNVVLIVIELLLNYLLLHYKCFVSEKIVSERDDLKSRPLFFLLSVSDHPPVSNQNSPPVGTQEIQLEIFISPNYHLSGYFHIYGHKQSDIQVKTGFCK